ncbi:MAG: winged helix-turn-helix domain-containing protein [Nitrososphaerales archaeon]
MSLLNLKRTAYEIIWEILDYCREPRKLTHIIQACNLNTPTTQKYLSLLVQKNMLSMSEKSYKTTKEGLKYLKLIEEIYLALFSK